MKDIIKNYYSEYKLSDINVYKYKINNNIKSYTFYTDDYIPDINLVKFMILKLDYKDLLYIMI